MPHHNVITIQPGARFNFLTFVHATDSINGERRGTFQCDCGTVRQWAINRVTNGYAKSCGCSPRGAPSRHGHAANGRETPTYEAWASMKKRCLNPFHAAYKDYGGRGISVCDRWLVFENFLADMGERPSGKSLDRLKNELGYAPGNCEWRTAKEQNNNKRGNTVIEFAGQKLTISQWADKTGIKDCTLSERLRRGWGAEKALTTPTRKY